jgi:hypothetical protein
MAYKYRNLIVTFCWEIGSAAEVDRSRSHGYRKVPSYLGQVERWVCWRRQ